MDLGETPLNRNPQAAPKKEYFNLINLYGATYDRIQLLRHVGDVSQIAHAKMYQLTDGNEKGVDAIDFRTGSGLNFTVLPSRGLDYLLRRISGNSTLLAFKYRRCESRPL